MIPGTVYETDFCPFEVYYESVHYPSGQIRRGKFPVLTEQHGYEVVGRWNEAETAMSRVGRVHWTYRVLDVRYRRII